MKDFGKRALRIVLISAAILLIPLFAMQFTDEVDWGWGDFLLAFLLLLVTGLLIEIFIRNVPNKKYRRLLIGILLLCLMLLWAELGVGLFGSTIAGD